MKSKLISIFAMATLAFAASTSTAAESTVGNLGMKIAEKIISAVAGEIIGDLFGDGPSGLTKAEVAQAINDAFEKATTQEMNQMQQALANKIRIYDQGNYDQAWEIMNDAGNLQALVESHISKGNSTVAIPAFVAAWNARLTFAAEGYRIQGTDSAKQRIVTESLHGLSYLNSYMRNYFRDTTRNNNPCIKKVAETRLRLNGAVGSNMTEKLASAMPFKRIDVSTQYCFGNGRVLKDNPKVLQMAAMMTSFSDDAVINLGGAWYMRTTDMGKALHEDLWLFAGKTSATGNDYFLEQSKSEEFAHMLRNQYILRRYPDDLGDLHSNVLGWIDIVKAMHTTTSEMRTALNYAVKLGIGWNTLKSRYKADMNGAAGNEVAETMTQIYALGETRAILD